MPELPEVEVVRAGLARHMTGRTVTRVEVLDPRPLRRQDGGAQAFVDQLTGRTVTAAVRRGKFLWLPLDDGRALSAHLGMSGQLLVRGTAPTSGPEPDTEPVSAAPFLADPDARPGGRPVDLSATVQPRYVRDLSTSPRHLRIRLHLSDAAAGGTVPDPGSGAVLDLVDQRMLGGLHVVDLVPTADGAPGGAGSPEPLLPADATHIARDLLDPALQRTGTGGVVDRVRASNRAIKTLLLDQGLVSGIGNIYADEGLWEAGVHGLRPGTALGPRVVSRILQSTAEVMTRALKVGGTSFDALYVDVDGAAGFFARELGAYGRQGLDCRRCGATMLREVLAGRSHTYCPRCQTRPRRPGRPQRARRER
ncbi:bifunctional DNA-formamidopyrimidine glycosylase/DNA-(apurinic or apyrimidinic site) lyase [Actinomyces viscosus]|uniref:Formamidopyrimidine-DNA glycosylase n=1 Tax=Actinomyces viscosus TaxID=1656 RepID=A0A448PI54_ACTVI|nr:bifunctional DNA-formamidopyrimidine glycosylase/DNA-(apurinic or apyrimidinic site) lyase [Actinomyces viscosus]TFH53494.1 bifunctional DNA-formamidopyrimidine glycosylase/DNA-(apurinic or apyrimidinic site) lyase [Actinomyces viscosus]VEI14553.1 Formamidopyrimidine-DNA glycosylase [Actinomyces viscosus]